MKAASASWTAFFLAKEFDVAAIDTADGAEQPLRALVDRFWPSLESMGLIEAGVAQRTSVLFSPQPVNCISAVMKFV